MHNMRRVISLLLAAMLVIGTFAGCSGKKGKEAQSLIQATAVQFAKAGAYKTTVTSEKVDLSGITAENIAVRYADPDAAIDPESLDPSDMAAMLTALYPRTAKVESVTANGNGFEISFTDEKAAEYATGAYVITFPGTDETADVAVEFPEITLTPDVEAVVSNAAEAKVTLTIDGSEFEDGIRAEDLSLENSFAEMTVESLSAAGKNLTLLLKGTPVRSAANSYEWGAVTVKPAGIKDGFANVTAKIAIQPADAYLDSSSLKFENGKIIADLKVFGVANVDTLTAENVKLDGVTVEAAEKTDDNTVRLTIAADGVQSVNDFVDLTGRKEMMLGDYQTENALAQASFYPVFDYVEEDGDNLKLTLKLYANGGEFDSALKTDAVRFADAFANAKAESLTVEDASLATLILSVPADGQTAETLDMSGTVALAAGALTSVWGEKTAKESVSTRDYTGETLGREVTLNADTLLEIQKYTRGLNTVFGKICYYGQMAGTVYSIGKSVLEAMGVIESEHVQEMNQLKEINAKLDDVLKGISAIRQDLVKIMDDNVKSQLVSYNDQLDSLAKKVRDLNNVYIRAGKDMAKEDSKYAKIDWENMSEADTAAYNHAVFDFILDKAANPRNTNYTDYLGDCTQLKQDFEGICAKLERTGDNNPIRLYDQSCAYTYNFDSQAYNIRLAQRMYVETILTKALAALAIRYDAVYDEDNVNFRGLTEDFKNAITNLRTMDDIGISPLDAKANMAGTDASVYPYSYVFGKRIRFLDSKSSTTYYDGLRGTLKSGGSYRDWTNEERDAFVARMHGRTLAQEFTAAGFDTSLPLLTSIGSEKHNGYYNQYTHWTYYEYRGIAMRPGNSSFGTEHVATYYTARTDGKALEKKKLMDTCALELF